MKLDLKEHLTDTSNFLVSNQTQISKDFELFSRTPYILIWKDYIYISHLSSSLYYCSVHIFKFVFSIHYCIFDSKQWYLYQKMITTNWKYSKRLESPPDLFSISLSNATELEGNAIFIAFISASSHSFFSRWDWFRTDCGSCYGGHQVTVHASTNCWIRQLDVVLFFFFGFWNWYSFRIQRRNAIFPCFRFPTYRSRKCVAIFASEVFTTPLDLRMTPTPSWCHVQGPIKTAN